MAQTNEVTARFLRIDLEQILAHVGEERHVNDVKAEAALVDDVWLDNLFGNLKKKVGKDGIKCTERDHRCCCRGTSGLKWTAGGSVGCS
ncbi:hypothetical protein V6N11_006807 [Hibiscus sabdariffa]|uniref:Uncharacterized protein n=1 Tax=Hibiscus sabdariffa TaxID=183260 RepID=A0ABR2RSB7_9ROSI